MESQCTITMTADGQTARGTPTELIMPFASALSTKSTSRTAIAEVLAIRDQLPGPVDLAVVFWSPHYSEIANELAGQLVGALESRCLIGCQGESIIGINSEIEDGPALSLWLANWGGQVTVEPMHLTAVQVPDGPSIFGWPDSLSDADPVTTNMLLLGDPYSFPAADLFLPRITEDCPGLRVHGGMASGMNGSGQAALVLNDESKEQGAVGVLLHGSTGLRSVVSQGCRPVGSPFVITRAKENVIFELGGKPSVYAIRTLLEGLTKRDQSLFQSGPHLGLAMKPEKSQFGPGDLLVRNLIGLDPDNGAIAITDRVRAGQTVQFMVRDAQSADDDLREWLSHSQPAPQAALLFSCNGRGTRMFSSPNHDAGAIAKAYGNIPVAGFFAAGEIGPIAGVNYLHGFTASAVLFD